MTNDQLYNHVIDLLKADKRPLIKLNEDQSQSLKIAWEKAVADHNNEELFKILCILDNTVTLSNRYFDIIKTSLDSDLDSEMKVLTLGVARKHVIECAHKNGERVHYDFILLLKTMLKQKDPEVLEWTLRLIEGLGNQGIILKEDVLAASPGILAIFNTHKKAAKQIIELLKKRWTKR